MEQKTGLNFMRVFLKTKKMTMKNHCFLTILTMLSFLSSCDKDMDCPTCENYSDAFVIGFDPCTGVGDPNGGNVGFIIAIPAQKDTVVAYNFPKGIYEFPEEYFENYRFNPFFPNSAMKDFPVKVKYRFPQESEKTFIVCRGDILTYNLFLNNENEIVIISIKK